MCAIIYFVVFVKGKEVSFQCLSISHSVLILSSASSHPPHNPAIALHCISMSSLARLDYKPMLSSYNSRSQILHTEPNNQNKEIAA